MAYLSWILANRNDGYGGDHHARISSFARYLGWLDELYPGTFELVVCDWNPPSPSESMADGFDWSMIERATFVTVSREIHADLARGANSPILDYVARNVAIRFAAGEYVCDLNQDIYLSADIAAFLGERRLSPEYFYRADRCDFVPDFERMKDPAEIEALAQSQVFRLHRRGRDRLESITVDVERGTPVEEWPGTEATDGETKTGQPQIIRPTQGEREAIDRRITQHIKDVRDGRVPQSRLYKAYNLHTNACGDFIVATKAAFERIHGFVETSRFYMHTDSYGLVQLRTAGYKQAIFRKPAFVYHADHDRSGREGRKESFEYEKHEGVWSAMLSGECSPALNDDGWGLAGFELPVRRMRFGEWI